MILLNIFLCYMIWLFVVWICGQHKYSNIFEQLSLWFAIGLSLLVVMLFWSWVMFDTFSRIGMVIAFFIVLGLFLYQIKVKKIEIKEILDSFKNTYRWIIAQFIKFKKWQKIVWFMIIILCLLKIIMVFQTNIQMPTYDEDAVAGRDMKTKIFHERNSLVLDNKDPEFLWTALSRIVYAPLVDYYFIQGIQSDDSRFNNIISPLVYLNIMILLFGLLMRYTNLWWALLWIYMFISLPFLRIQWIWSYRNLPFAYLIFMFWLYLSEIFETDSFRFDSKKIILLAILSFIVVWVRNEWIVLLGWIRFITFLYHYVVNKKIRQNKINLLLYVSILIWWITSFVGTTYVKSLAPVWIETESHLSMIFSSDVVWKFIWNINQNGVLIEPFKQMVYHSDYNLLYIVFVLSIILNFNNIKIKTILIQFIFLLSILLLLLWWDLWFGLISHLWFIRYSVLISLYIIFITTLNLYDFNKNNKIH